MGDAEHLARLLAPTVTAARTEREDFIAEIDRAFGNDYFFGDQKADELRTSRDDQEKGISEPDRDGINKLPWASKTLDAMKRTSRLERELFGRPKTAAKAAVPPPTFPDAPPELAQVLRDWYAIKQKYAEVATIYNQMQEQEKGMREQVGDLFNRLHMKTAKVDNLLIEYKETALLNYPYSKMWAEALAKVNAQTRALLQQVADDMANPTAKRTVKVTPVPKPDEEEGAMGPEYVAAARKTAGIWSRLKAGLAKLLGSLDRSIQILEKALSDTKGEPMRVESRFDWNIGDDVQLTDPYKGGRIVDIVPYEPTRKTAFRIQWEDGQASNIPCESLDYLTKCGEAQKTSTFEDWFEGLMNAD